MSTVEGVEATGHTVGHGITRKVGPFPVWVWLILLLVGGFVGWRLYKARQASDLVTTGSDTTDTTVSADTAPLAVDTADTDTGLSGTGGVNATGVTNEQVNGSLVSTNQEWQQTVSNALIANGSGSPTDVSNAVSNYLNGVALTSVQQALISIAILQYGVPPGGVIPVSAVPAAVYYTTGASDTLGGIAQRYYNKPAWWSAIHAANLYDTPDNATTKVKSGTKLIIPPASAIHG